MRNLLPDSDSGAAIESVADRLREWMLMLRKHEAAGVMHLGHINSIGQQRIGIRALLGWRIGVGPVYAFLRVWVLATGA
jgi:hypothetical protein